MKKNKIINYILVMALSLLFACGVPKDVLQSIAKGKKEMIDLPVDYCNVFPSIEYYQWDNDYNAYDKYLTHDIMITQLGLASHKKTGVQTWFCFPAVRTHVQLDTATMIIDNKALVGEWRIACNRKIDYLDSAVYADKKVYRDSKVIYDEKDADLFLKIRDGKFRLYGRENENSHFRQIAHANYAIANKRFLMLYGVTKANAAISFIGIDKTGRLIINTHLVEERKKEGIYNVYESVMTQMIFVKSNG